MCRLLFLYCLLMHNSLATELDFGIPGGEPVKKVDEVLAELREEPYDLELLLSFGTSSKGSAGHLAISVREDDKETVYSANFYANPSDEYKDRYTDSLIPAIDKKEYIYSQVSKLSEKAEFGLDYGEIFKRSLIGIRISGVDEIQKKGIHAFYKTVNKDYSEKARDTYYHKGQIIYNYMKLNCAKLVAQGMKYGAGYDRVKVRGNHLLAQLPGSKYIFSHTPTATTFNILKTLSRYHTKFSVVLYKKFEDSRFYDQELQMQFRELPNRFPSFKSLDFFNGSTAYESFDNLRAMHLLYHLGQYSLIIDGPTQELRIERSVEPKSYQQAMKLASEEAYSKSKNLLRRVFRSMGIKITSGNDNSDLY